MKFLKIFTIIIITIIIAGCAQIVTPSGGSKDEVEPKVVNYIPNNKSINFKKENQTIRIKFDEFIKLEDAAKQIIISPPLISVPEYIVNGKELRIILNETLQTNTTYTINFGNAIIDNHEGLSAKNIQYLFSTGSFLDSNFISGKIYNAFTGLPSTDINICLYKKSVFTDSTLTKINPTYFTKSTTNGTFKIENLPLDEYIIYAFKKEGNNLKYEKNDSLAILQNSINSSITEKNIELNLFKNNEYKINRIFDTLSNQMGIYNFVVYKPTNDFINYISNSYKYKLIKGIDYKDTIKIFVNNNNIENKFRIKTNDTSYILSLRTKNKTLKNELIMNAITDITPDDTLIIEFNNPIEKINLDSIIFKEDTIITKPLYFEISNDRLTFKLFNKWNENTNYTLLIKDSSISDIFNNFNKLNNISIAMKPLKDYGNLILNLELVKTDKNYIVQLLNKNNDEVIKEYFINESKQIKIDYLKPVEAKIKIIEDRNKNGVWDTGDLETMRLPEKVFNYNQIFNIRAYWELEQNININSIINQQ
jgi:hypothetical protein